MHQLSVRAVLTFLRRMQCIVYVSKGAGRPMVKHVLFACRKW